VDNFRPGVLAQMGFDKARLAELNPRRATANINGSAAPAPRSIVLRSNLSPRR